MFKRILACVLTCLMVFSMVACGEQAAPSQGGNNQAETKREGFVFQGMYAKEQSVKLGNPDAELDPQKIYSSITYIPEMFYGDYGLRGGDTAEEKFGQEANYFQFTKDGKEVEYSTLPFRLVAGKETMLHSVNYVKDHHWMEAYFMRRIEDAHYLDTVICAYEVIGNKLVLKPLESFQVDRENNKITYAFSDLVWEYTFAFSGRTLTLSSGADSVTLTGGLDAYREYDYFYVDNYLSEGSKSFAGIDQIDFRFDSQDKSSRLYFELKDGNESHSSVAVLQENGLFTFTLALEESVKTYQCVYFYCGDDGLVLTDGKEVYLYNETYSDRQKLTISKYLTEEQTAKLDNMSEYQLEVIAEKSENLLEDLAAAYQSAGLQVAVNTQTGEIALDSTVLFGVNEANISVEGQEFLKKFIQIYASVVFNEKYADFVSTIMVEGHTDTSGSYELNQKLSQERADSVKDYCLSEDCGIEHIYAIALQDMLRAVGHSYDKPIYNENGEVDMDASRRVSFRFIVNLG